MEGNEPRYPLVISDASVDLASSCPHPKCSGSWWGIIMHFTGRWLRGKRRSRITHLDTFETESDRE